MLAAWLQPPGRLGLLTAGSKAVGRRDSLRAVHPPATICHIYGLTSGMKSLQVSLYTESPDVATPVVS